MIDYAPFEAMPVNGRKYTLTTWLIFLYVASVIGFSFNAEDVIYSNLFGIILTFTFTMETLLKRLSFFPKFAWPLSLFFCFVLISAWSLMGAPEGYLRVRTLALLFVLTLVLSNVICNTGNLRPVILGVFAGLGFAIVVGMRHADPLSSERIGSTLGNANIYALALLVGTLFCIYNLLFAGSKRMRKGVVLSSLACIPLFGFQIMFLTGSRKGILVFCAVLASAYLFFVARQRKKVKIFSVAGGIALALAVGQAIVFSPHFKRLESVYSFLPAPIQGKKV